MPLLGYLITWTCYGTWLPGDQRTSVVHSNIPGSPYESENKQLRRSAERHVIGNPVLLNSLMRTTVREAIIEHAQHKGWRVHALSVRTNHIHAVVTAPVPPERVMTAFKSWATRALRARELVEMDQKVWTRHGSTRYLSTEASLHGAIAYVEQGQGMQIDR